MPFIKEDSCFFPLNLLLQPEFRLSFLITHIHLHMIVELQNTGLSIKTILFTFKRKAENNLHLFNFIPQFYAIYGVHCYNTTHKCQLAKTI